MMMRILNARDERYVDNAKESQPEQNKTKLPSQKSKHEKRNVCNPFRPYVHPSTHLSSS